MGSIGLLALAANVASVLLLMRYTATLTYGRLCSRSDAIGNIAVMIAALAVGARRRLGRT